MASKSMPRARRVATGTKRAMTTRPAKPRKTPDKADALAKAEVQTNTRPKFLRVAKPDAIDFRDRPFRPNVSVTPQVTLFPNYTLGVKHQGDTNACTGFGLSLVVEHLLRKSGREARSVISPFMLYSMARRYDEFPGSVADDGSSLRGALKGWFKHGACSQALFPGLDMPAASESLDRDWWLDAVRRPLGAYYRIDPRSITDMHAALNEVGILYVSCGCHSGWDEGVKTRPLKRRPASFRGIWEIPLLDGHAQHPGHAFAVVGYNEAGFLIQNSWGTDWGSYGYAILTYEDWLRNAMDCWVAQLGVVTREHEDIARSITLRSDAAGKVALASSEVLRNREISPFIVNMANNGALSNSGTFRTKPDDVRAIVDVQLAIARKAWKLGANDPVDVCIYAHGGLVGEQSAADIAAFWIPFLYERQVFPVFLMWETDFITTVMNTIEDRVKGVPRAAGWSPSIERWWNQRLERVLARPGTQIWGEMKQNAEAISAFRPDVEDDQQAGAVLMYRHFKHGVADRKIRLHLVGHSAGAIVLTHMIDRLVEDGMEVESLSFLAPAVTVKEFDKHLRPHLATGTVKRFQQVHLSDQAEEDDPTCGPYRRSLLYLVSESFEGGTTTPILGMQKYFDAAAADLPRTSVHVSPAARDPKKPDAIPVASSSHGGFDNDPGTQAVVLGFIQAGR